MFIAHMIEKLRAEINAEGGSVGSFPEISQVGRSHYVGIYTWNPCFDWKGPSFGGLKPINRGQTDSRYI